MQEFGSGWDWLPKTLVDWAQILSAIGTCGAVIVSLWIATRRVKPDLRIDASCVLFIGVSEPGAEPEYFSVSASNVGIHPVMLTALGWQVRRRWWLGYRRQYAHQLFDRAVYIGNPPLPHTLSPAQEARFYLPLQGIYDWRHVIARSEYFREHFDSRRSLDRLRLAIGTSTGVICRAKPDAKVLDLIWVELQNPPPDDELETVT
ncbi:hypothetical protein [Roseateles chitinivorans]|uniref:hypothetical protein n=1 Tax=Roseateles chitinivorans TaxID=2917965 RepID=UPI00117E0773|nr:hypothetical protein [Roseateles chitinivorans]